MEVGSVKVYAVTMLALVDRRRLGDYLDSLSSISTWLSPFEGLFLIVTDLDLNILTGRVAKRIGPLFLISEIDGKRAQGLLPSDCWNLINDPPLGNVSAPPPASVPATPA